MARSVAEINQYIVDNLVINFAAIGIAIDPTLWSKRNILRAMCYTIAIGSALLEQLWDAFMVLVETQVAIAAAASAAWVQDRMFKFQYSDTNPQFVVLIEGVPAYPTIDATLRIITACSVTSDVSNTVSIKVAKGNPFIALASNELSAAQGYINTIGTAGINYSVISLDPDQLYIVALLYFQGQYASTIQTTTIAAIDAWLQNQSVINFNGKVKMSDLETMLRAIPGMTDVELIAVRGRASASLFEAGIDLILNAQILQREYNTNAGYLISEQTAGKTLSDTLTFIAE